MSASYETVPPSISAGRIYEALFQTNSARLRQSFPARDFAGFGEQIEATWRPPDTYEDLIPADLALQLVQDRADIDISGLD